MTRDMGAIRPGGRWGVKAALGMAAVLAIPVAAYAQAGDAETQEASRVLNEVTVTATRRETTLQDTPLSVSVADGAVLRETGVENLENLSVSVPNFQVNTTPIGDTISIRGISTFTQPGTEQSVATMVDGIFRGRDVQSRFAFLDIERVEVVRGPQGTLFGKNAVAGALNITTAKPTDEWSGTVSAAYEFEQDEQKYEGFVSGPVTDAFRFRLAGRYNELEKGWVRNGADGKTLPNLEESAVRLSLEADATEALTLSAKYEHGNFQLRGQPFEVLLYDGDFSILSGTALAITNAIIAAGDVNGIDGFSVISNTDPLDVGDAFFMDTTLDEMLVRADWQIGPGTLVAILGHSEYEFDRDLDADNDPLSIISSRQDEAYEQQSFELRYVSDPIGDLSFITGVYWQQSEIDVGSPNSGTFIDLTSVGAPLPQFNRNSLFEQSAETHSVFGEVSYQILPDVEVSLGGRYVTEEKTGSQDVDIYTIGGDLYAEPLRSVLAGVLNSIPHDIDLAIDEEDFTLSANVQWEPTDSVTVFGRYAEGIKGGGFNANYFGTTPQQPDETDAAFQQRMSDEATFDPERASTYEAGIKATLNQRTQLNLAIFHSEFEDLQVTQFTGGTTFIVGNAAEARSRGIELDGRWLVSDDLELFGNLAWLDFEFTDYATAGCTALQAVAYGGDVAACSRAGGNDLTGRTNNNSPELTFAVGFDYTHRIGQGLELGLRSDLNYVSEYYGAADLDPATLQDAFVKINAVVSLVSDHGWELALVGRNLTDELTFADANDLPFATGSTRVSVQRPRSIALRLAYDF